jgi:acetylornithine/succinyldiaminopimelate/putrescine aminotransferase
MIFRRWSHRLHDQQVVPSAERVRFANTGTEAARAALHSVTSLVHTDEDADLTVGAARKALAEVERGFF